jgi:hypothetical protein
MNPTARDIVHSRAWADMVTALEAHLHAQFTLASARDLMDLQLARLRWDSLRSVIAALEHQATEESNAT